MLTSDSTDTPSPPLEAMTFLASSLTPTMVSSEKLSILMPWLPLPRFPRPFVSVPIRFPSIVLPDATCYHTP